MEVAVVGAGISGLTAATLLRERACGVKVFEKARGPGGRMATRRRGDHMFDLGAQYFTASDPRFRATVNSWIQDGLAERWTGRIGFNNSGNLGAVHTQTNRYVSVPRMSAITRHLSGELDVAYKSRVDGLRRESDRWVLDVNGCETGPFDAVIITTPPQQAGPLLTESPQLAEAAAGVTMLPCWALMLVFEQPIPVGYDGIFVNQGEISWAARNNSKPGRPEIESWVAHASHQWSVQNLEIEPHEAVSNLLPSFFESLVVPFQEPIVSEAHRWRFAQVDNPLSVGCLWDESKQVIVAGDWVNGSKVEGAFLSGLAAAERVLGIRK